jgi:hypothetical protein
MRGIQRPEKVEYAHTGEEISVKPEECRRQESYRADDWCCLRVDRRHAEHRAKVLAAEKPQEDEQKAPGDGRSEKQLRLREEGYEHC